MKYLSDVHIKNKKVIVRCDFNVPINDGVVVDDSKIVKSLKTINYLLERNCKIILLSHLGRVKCEDDKKKYTLYPIKEVLEKHLEKKVTFVTDIDELDKIDDNIILFENTRWFDYPDNLESNNDLELSRKFASKADIFVFDAFATSHRIHASTAGIARFLPTYIGFLVKEELENLEKVVKNPQKPFIVIMGGAKVDDKIPLIKTLLPSCDKILLGGGIANSFLKAKGFNIGKSLATMDEEILSELKYLLELYDEKIILPVDLKVLHSGKALNRKVTEIAVHDNALDIGNKTINKFNSLLIDASTVFMNGTMGLYENKDFSNGTEKIFEKLKNIPTVLIGGGDTVGAVNVLGFSNFFLLSSGGGATLIYIAQKKLDVLEEIEKYEKEKDSL